MSDRETPISWHEKAAAIRKLVRFRPRFLTGLVVLGGLTAFLEGIGLSFIYPIMEVAQADGESLPSGPIIDGFLTVYETAGVPFELAYLILGISGVMIVRFTASFLVAWLRAILELSYQESLRKRAFESTLAAEVGYFDEAGSDDMLNAIITETRYSGKVIRRGVEAMETLFLMLIYLAIMVFIAPEMTVYAIVLLGGITYLLRNVIEPGYTVGARVANANEAIQESVQAGTQGIRDVKLFGLAGELYEEFWHSIQRYTRSSINLERNKAALQNGYDLAAALSLFVLIYIGFVYSGLSLGALGIFLFAMFRLAPLTSRLNSHVYQAEGNVSHLIRTQSFVEQLQYQVEDSGERPIAEATRITFDDVSFSYTDDEQVLDGLSFAVEKGEFVSFVGQSGAGKSTIVSLLARMYDPDGGEIRANGVPLTEYDLAEWRERIAVVRQHPYIFNDTLERNVTIGNRDASRAAVERVCGIAKVDEFVEGLPEGYDSQLGDDGVRLSGGQRQRLALARALLKDADVLVLDEATSDLDSSLEREVQAAIESMDQNYGIIAIAHRLSTVKNADRIYTVDDGEIVETGTHHELLGDDGEYSDLYTIQSRG